MALDDLERQYTSFVERWHDLLQRQKLNKACKRLEQLKGNIDALSSRLDHVNKAQRRERLVNSARRSLTSAMTALRNTNGQIQAAKLSAWILPSVVKASCKHVEHVADLCAASERVIESH